MSERTQIYKLVRNFLKEAKLPPVLVILGPTASGKTALSIDLAQRFDGEVISADSRQVYRGIDIASVKVTPEEMQNIPHHLLDIRNPDETLTAQEWKKLAEEKIIEIQKRGKIPIVCGGTTLYISGLVQNFDFGKTEPNPELRQELEQESVENLAKKLKKLSPTDAEKINPKNKRHLIRAVEVALTQKPKSTQKPKFDFLEIGIKWEREKLYARLNQRAENYFADGLIEETKNLRKKYSLDLPALTSFGYAEVCAYLDGEITLEEAITQNQQRNRNYAKRQMTWWKRDKNIHWFAGELL